MEHYAQPSSNENVVNELAEGVSQYPLGGFENVQILAAVGQKYGAIYGSKLERVTDKSSPHYGKVVVDKEGISKLPGKQHYLWEPAIKLSWLVLPTPLPTKTFLSFQVDGRFGGKYTASPTVRSRLRVFRTSQPKWWVKTLYTMG